MKFAAKCVLLLVLFATTAVAQVQPGQSPLSKAKGGTGNTIGQADTAVKLATPRSIDGQSFDGSADISVVAPATHAAASKSTPVDADEMPIADSSSSFVLKKLTWSNLKSSIAGYLASLTQTLTGKTIDTASNVVKLNGTTISQSGNTATVVTTTGAHTSNNCAKWDVNGNVVDAGSACGAGGGGASLVLLNTLTASSSASLQDTTSFSNGFSVYEIELINLTPATNAVDCSLQFQSGGVFQTSNYAGAEFAITSSAATSASSAWSSFVHCSGIVGHIGNSPTGAGVSGRIRIYKPSSSSVAKHIITQLVEWRSDSVFERDFGGGAWNSTAAVTGFKISMSSGNIASGTVKVYGVQ